MNQPRKIATATYAKDLGERGLTYGINRQGKHVVIVAMVPGEDICPTHYRYDTVTEARATWKRIVSCWVANGYVPADKYWAELKARYAGVR